MITFLDIAHFLAFVSELDRLQRLSNSYDPSPICCFKFPLKAHFLSVVFRSVRQFTLLLLKLCAHEGCQDFELLDIRSFILEGALLHRHVRAQFFGKAHHGWFSGWSFVEKLFC